MNAFAAITMIAAWACFFLAPKSTASRLAQFFIFGLLGAIFTLAGGFSYWWDSGMRPTQKSAFPLICGLVILASQVATFLAGALGGDDDTD